MTRPALPLVLFALTSCAAPPRQPLRVSDYPGELLPPSTLTPDVLWRQRVTVAWREPGGEPMERVFDAALQKQGGTLTVAFLSPFGAVGMSMILEDGSDEIAFTNDSGREFPLPPRFVVLDVQRVFYPLKTATSRVRDGEVTAEVRQAGKIIRRWFERDDGKPPGKIEISYEWGQPDWVAPTKAVLQNGWFGYSLTVETLEETRL